MSTCPEPQMATLKGVLASLQPGVSRQRMGGVTQPGWTHAHLSEPHPRCPLAGHVQPAQAIRVLGESWGILAPTDAHSVLPPESAP